VRLLRGRAPARPGRAGRRERVPPLLRLRHRVLRPRARHHRRDRARPQLLAPARRPRPRRVPGVLVLPSPRRRGALGPARPHPLQQLLLPARPLGHARGLHAVRPGLLRPPRVHAPRPPRQARPRALRGQRARGHGAGHLGLHPPALPGHLPPLPGRPPAHRASRQPLRAAALRRSRRGAGGRPAAGRLLAHGGHRGAAQEPAPAGGGLGGAAGGRVRASPGGGGRSRLAGGRLGGRRGRARAGGRPAPPRLRGRRQPALALPQLLRVRVRAAAGGLRAAGGGGPRPGGRHRGQRGHRRGGGGGRGRPARGAHRRRGAGRGHGRAGGRRRAAGAPARRTLAAYAEAVARPPFASRP
jgi:hypothetical protein